MKKKRQNILEENKRDVIKANRLQAKVDSGLSSPTDTSVAVPLSRLENLLPDFTDIVNQPKNAARKDRTNSLTHIIYEIVRETPNIDIKKLLDKLESYTVLDVIVDITEDDIEWIDQRGTHKFTTISAIKSRLYRAIKKLNKQE